MCIGCEVTFLCRLTYLACHPPCQRITILWSSCAAGVSNPLGKAPRPLLWAGSRAVLAEAAVTCPPNRLNYFTFLQFTQNLQMSSRAAQHNMTGNGLVTLHVEGPSLLSDFIQDWNIPIYIYIIRRFREIPSSGFRVYLCVCSDGRKVSSDSLRCTDGTRTCYSQAETSCYVLRPLSTPLSDHRQKPRIM